MKRNRLCYLSAGPRVSTRPSAELAGPRSHVLGVIKSFESLGWKVSRFIIGDRMPEGFSSNGSEKSISSSPLRSLAADGMRLALGCLNARRAWREVGRDVDMVYERFAVLQSLGWIFRKHGIPWILETNGLLFEEAKKERRSIMLSGLARRIEVSAYQSCDVLVCVSQALKRAVIEKAGVDERKIVVIPNGVDTDVYDPIHASPRRIFDGFTIGFVGNVISWQGLNVLLEAAASLHQSGVPVHLVIVGDGPARQDCERIAASLGLCEQVRFTGRVPPSEVPDYIAGFDVGFSGQVPLSSNPMYHSPLKLYEYMSMGKPVIASAFDDAKNLVRPNQTGFLFTPGNAADLERSILEAYRQRDSLGAYGLEAREEIVANHSWRARIEHALPYIEDVLKRR